MRIINHMEGYVFQMITRNLHQNWVSNMGDVHKSPAIYGTSARVDPEEAGNLQLTACGSTGKTLIRSRIYEIPEHEHYQILTA